jgi:hypothetical protein
MMMMMMRIYVLFISCLRVRIVYYYRILYACFNRDILKTVRRARVVITRFRTCTFT